METERLVRKVYEARGIGKEKEGSQMRRRNANSPEQKKMEKIMEEDSIISSDRWGFVYFS